MRGPGAGGQSAPPLLKISRLQWTGRPGRALLEPGSVSPLAVSPALVSCGHTECKGRESCGDPPVPAYLSGSWLLQEGIAHRGSRLQEARAEGPEKGVAEGTEAGPWAAGATDVSLEKTCVCVGGRTLWWRWRSSRERRAVAETYPQMPARRRRALFLELKAKVKTRREDAQLAILFFQISPLNLSRQVTDLQLKLP